MGEALISLRKVSKRIGSEEVLKDINLEVKRGEFLSITGASGSGKSSLLYIMGLLDKPSEGEVLFENSKINFSDEREISRIRNRKVGFVFQFHYLLPEFSALENVALPMLKGGVGKREAFERARELLEKVGLGGKEGRRPYQLSGGEQQRVSIARALANEPSVILADEPTGNLDSKNTEVVMEIFMKLNSEGRTVVMVTHEENLARRAHRRIELKDGRIFHEELQGLHG